MTFWMGRRSLLEPKPQIQLRGTASDSKHWTVDSKCKLNNQYGLLGRKAVEEPGHVITKTKVKGKKLCLLPPKRMKRKLNYNSF